MEEREVGELIQFLMNERKITLKKLAYDTGISEYKLRKTIQGERHIYQNEIQTIGDYFSIPFLAFFDLHYGLCKSDTKIIRYMDFAKFLSLLNTSKLHFTSGDKFEDVFEGKIPEAFFMNMTNEFKEEYLKSYKTSKKSTYISCWSMATTESYALWKIFAPNYGVAIVSTANKLFKLIEHVNGMVYKVQYIEYGDKEFRVPVHKSIFEKVIIRNFFSLKSSVYKYEEEVRAIYMSENQVEVYIKDLNEFIEFIYVSPTSPSWFLDLVKDTVKTKFNLDIDVSLSNINLR